jgi:hypothetical protein
MRTIVPASLLIALTPLALAQVTIPVVDVPITENFDSLASSGTGTTLPTGWAFLETGTGANTSYSADNGALNTGNTYSYGATSASDRALGQLLSSSVTTVIGASFINNSGAPITALELSYIGEQWRLGTQARVDAMDFQYSLDATSLTTGTWTDLDGLDFTAPNTTSAVGALNGNDAANQSSRSASISGLNLTNSGTVWIRWNDRNASGADDGLSIDNFSITARGTGGGQPGITIADASTLEGNAAVSLLNFQVNLSSPAPVAGVTMSVALVDDSATLADNDFLPLAASTLTIPATQSSGTVAVSVVGDSNGECPERFKVVLSNPSNAVLIDGEAIGSIRHDDPVEVFAIQGRGNASCFVGALDPVVSNGNVVTAVVSNGFMMQTPDARADNDPLTSNGVFVFTGAAPALVSGQAVDITGSVVEFFGSTQFTNSGLVLTPGSTGQTLPTPVQFNSTRPSPSITAPSCAPSTDREVANFECFEGMRVQVAQGITNSANQSFGTDPLGENVVTASPLRSLREPGIPFPGFSGLPASIPIWDTNPEVFELDADRISGTPTTLFGNFSFQATGVLAYEFNDYELWPTELNVPQQNVIRVAPSGNVNDLSIGSINMLRFFDTTAANNTTTQCDGTVASYASDTSAISTPERYEQRLRRFAAYIAVQMRAPDIIAVQEVENIGVLNDLAAMITRLNSNLSYSAALVEGNDVGGIDVGFLYRADRLANVVVSQREFNARLSVDNSCLHDRPPLQLTATSAASGVGAITVFVNHTRSLGGIGDCRITTGGNPARICQKRLEQAQSIATLMQAAQASSRVIMVGDINAFEVTDGHVDVLGQITGRVVAAENQLSAPSVSNPQFTDLVTQLPVGERYSFNFFRSATGQGMVENVANALDHAVVSANVLPMVQSFAFLRGNADGREDLAIEPVLIDSRRSGFEAFEGASPTLGLSDHDGFVLRLRAN